MGGLEISAMHMLNEARCKAHSADRDVNRNGCRPEILKVGFVCLIDIGFEDVDTRLMERARRKPPRHISNRQTQLCCPNCKLFNRPDR